MSGRIGVVGAGTVGCFYGAKLLKAAFDHEIEDDFLESRVANTRLMGAYKTSSLLDHLAGREVEVESIWGEPLRAAQSRGVSIPRIEMLHGLLRQLTSIER